MDLEDWASAIAAANTVTNATKTATTSLCTVHLLMMER